MLVDSKRVVEFVSLVQEPVGIDLYWILRRLYMNKKLLRQQRKKVKKRMRTDAAIGTISGCVTLLEGAGWPGSFEGAAHLRGVACSEFSTSTIGDGGRYRSCESCCSQFDEASSEGFLD